MFEIKGKFNTAKVFASNINDAAISQIVDMCNQEYLKDCNIAIMPDAHAGKGCTIGTTIALKDKVCPSLVGVDISCGMLVVEIPKHFKLNLPKIDEYITNNIPSGFEVNEDYQMPNLSLDIMLKDMKCFNKLKDIEHIKKSLGSLGSGNHFLEVNEGSDGKHYLVVHSGSRNLGKQVAEIYQDIADEYCNHAKADKIKARNELIKNLKSQGRYQEIQDKLKEFNKNYKEVKKIPHDLCYIEGQDMHDYLHDAKICNEYARLSRVSMAVRILKFIAEDNNAITEDDAIWLDEPFPNIFEFGYETPKIDFRTDGFQTLHNYIGDDNILRKGAISAKKGEKVIIPINMRDGSIIAIGKGNKDYNYSGPHGAGRVLSRLEADKKIKLEDFKESMKGIYTSSVVQSTVDESPFAYKSIDDIIDNIKDTVEIIDIIKPIYNFKAH